MKLKQKGEKGPFLAGTGRERERRRREEREAPHFLYDLQISSGRFASGQDLKSEHSSRATRGHQNQEFSSEIRAESSGGHGFRASGSSKALSSLQEVGNLLTRVSFHIGVVLVLVEL